MGRIRTIKPEFPLSESIGRLSRDARLLFILLWTLVDDSGRTRGGLAIIRGALFPYDDDAAQKIAGWMDELVREDLVAYYEVEGTKYLEIRNWLKHQKIDRPTPSRLPAFDESSTSTRRILDAGPRTMDLGSINTSADASVCTRSRVTRTFSKPSLEEARAYAHENQIDVNTDEWYDHYESNGWKVGRNPMRDWRAALRKWSRRQNEFASSSTKARSMEFPGL